jgi:hypothetical protein
MECKRAKTAPHDDPGTASSTPITDGVGERADRRRPHQVQAGEETRLDGMTGG